MKSVAFWELRPRSWGPIHCRFLSLKVGWPVSPAPIPSVVVPMVIPATHTLIHESLPRAPAAASYYVCPSCSASPHFGRYSLPVPQRVGGWVGLGGWLHTAAVCPHKDVHRSQYHATDSAAVGDRTQRALSCKSDALTTRVPSHKTISISFIIRLKGRLQPNIGFKLYVAFWRCSRVRLQLRRKWTDLDEIWNTLSTLSGAVPDRFWAQSAQ